MITEHDLSIAMHAVETWATTAYGHRWHLYTSSTGEVWAVTTACPDRGGSGTTLETHTPDQMRREIAETEWAWARHRIGLTPPAGVA